MPVCSALDVCLPLLLLPVLVLPLAAAVFTFPANQYEYSLRRDQLKKAEEQFRGHSLTLSKDEQVVDNYLQHLKWVEFKETEVKGFPPSRPIEEQLEHIKASEVFRVLKQLPKGGNMHCHENHVVSKRKLLELVIASDQYEYLYLAKPGSKNEWTLDFFANPPDNTWVKVKGSKYTVDDIIPHQTLLGIMDDRAKSRPTDSDTRWRQMDFLWGRMSNLIPNLPIKKLHLKELYRSSLEENVQYIEARKNFEAAEDLYVIDTSPEYIKTHGKKYLDNQGGELEINETLTLVEEYMKQHTEMIGHTRIAWTVRVKDPQTVANYMHKVAKLHLKYPKHVKAVDLVAEEDAGNSHLYYVPSYLTLYDKATQQSSVPILPHTAETSWPDDLISSSNDKDPVATLENTYEAILLGAKRVGHGLGYIKHPYLMQAMKDRGVTVEACPLSNQLLGFTPDLRNHPAQTYFRSGINVVLGSDDPGTFGYDYFTLDWYEVFMGWGLDLADMKQLAMNALRFSSMSEEEITAAMVKWQKAWDKYIAEMKTEACKADFSTITPMFGMVFPRAGAVDGATTVHVYGRNFTSAVCKPVRCAFGDQISKKAVYISNNHIVCEAPAPATSTNTRFMLNSRLVEPETLVEQSAKEVTVEVTVDFGNNVFVNTGHTFTYKYRHEDNRGTGSYKNGHEDTTGTGSLTIPSTFLLSAMLLLSVLRQ